MALQQRSDEYVVDAPQTDAPRSVFLAERAFTGRRGGAIEQPALVVADGKILWVGPDAELPERYRQDDFFQYHYRGATLLPGMVERHAHLGGHRLGAVDRPAHCGVRGATDNIRRPQLGNWR